MVYFENFTSNTCASSANQHIFRSLPDQVQTGRVFYKITEPGSYEYSFLFSNLTDSTYADGSVGYRNLICGEWKILSARAAVYPSDAIMENFMEAAVADRINRRRQSFQKVKFKNKCVKEVAPGEFFASDPILMTFQPGDYLCLELTFSGTVMPYHEESLLPIFKKTEKGWQYDRKMPLPGMIGCSRKPEARIGYIGDSITQGIGTPHNAYTHWNALLSRKLGSRYAFWNLGIGYARADDMATLSAWAYKAKHNDILIMCCGVNDITRDATAEQVIRNLERMVAYFKKEGIKLVVQTLPPFDYNPEVTKVWHQVNSYILTKLSQKVDMVFDAAAVLSLSEEEPQRAKYGGHPDETGCAVWAEALYDALRSNGLA